MTAYKKVLDKQSGELTAAQNIVAGAPDFACICQDTRIVLVNDAGLTMLSSKPGTAHDPAGQPFATLIHPDDRWILESWWRPQEVQPTARLGIRRYCRVGSARAGYRYLELTRAEHAVGNIRYDLIFGRRIEDLRAVTQELQQTRKQLEYHSSKLRRERNKRRSAERSVRRLTFEDQLTRLANRAQFQRRLESALRHASRTDKKVVLLFIDLNKFKEVNDAHGHATGDALLRHIAHRLLSCTRNTDVVARFGSDEFAIIANHVEQASDVDTLAKKVLDTVEQPLQIDGQRLNITCSIGVSIYPDNGTDADTLQKNAALALQRAKSIGGGAYQNFNATMNAQIRRRKRIEHELTRAIAQDELVCYYQPQIDIATGDIKGVEALIRWDHPADGLIPPSEFIQIAESSGLIQPLTEWVMHRACSDLKQCHALGHPIEHVSVNLSANLLRDDRLLRMVKRVLEKTDLAPQYLEVEITESMVPENITAARQLLVEIAALGVGIALDDFGTGYSSLTHLRQFPLTSLKIDRSFVTEMSANADDIAIVRSVITLAHSLGLRVIAEGVEETEQLDILQKESCDEVQGYYYSPPLPYQALIEWCNTHRQTEARTPTRPVAGPFL
ncbi:MAG TPA: hypothetical protein DDW95_13290 [Alphaproteobacteria bacterium]|nr:hypothetical protein [Alphaproteobacteria bacterium]HAM46914.1 hypothetical protein [Alphaproteobacteria bacterium]HBC53699.1 hypothetical protein [Alphaproteobacteria bacterium]HBF99519.1 hypothetical protein [Alphaproteobacteria bacterium]HCO91034.1 hypothetical protein [Alphaproteobacteria bacterium]